MSMSVGKRTKSARVKKKHVPQCADQQHDYEYNTALQQVINTKLILSNILDKDINLNSKVLFLK